MTSDVDPNASETLLRESSLVSFRREGLMFGRFGLRAAWGIAAYIMVWFIAATLASVFALGVTGQMTRMMQAQSQPGAQHTPFKIVFTPLYATVNDGLPFFAMLGASWLFSRGERRPFGSYGIGRGRWSDVFSGGLWGLLLMSVLVWTLHAFRLLVFDSRALDALPAILFGMKWLVAFLLVGLAEEYFFRGYVQYTLMRGLWGAAARLSPSHARPVAFWTAATLLSCVFALLHGRNTGETHLGLFVVFLAGMTFAYALWRTGSLWWAIGFHTTWDWAQSFLFGVPDSGSVSFGRLFVTHAAGNSLLSGGSDGPEGSVFVVVALLLALVVLRFTPAGVQPAIEQTSQPRDEAHERGAVIS